MPKQYIVSELGVGRWQYDRSEKEVYIREGNIAVQKRKGTCFTYPVETRPSLLRREIVDLYHAAVEDINQRLLMAMGHPHRLMARC